MKINKQFVQEVANGKYDSYDTHGEMKRAAQRILEEKVVSKFSTFCFRIFGGEMPDNVMDAYDAFVDFSLHGTVIAVRHSEEKGGVYRFKGMTVEESLEKMNAWVWKTHQTNGYRWLENCEFQVEGNPDKYHLSLPFFHYCFAEGCITEKQLLDFSRVA